LYFVLVNKMTDRDSKVIYFAMNRRDSDDDDDDRDSFSPPLSLSPVQKTSSTSSSPVSPLSMALLNEEYSLLSEMNVGAIVKKSKRKLKPKRKFLQKSKSKPKPKKKATDSEEQQEIEEEKEEEEEEEEKKEQPKKKQNTRQESIKILHRKIEELKTENASLERQIYTQNNSVASDINRAESRIRKLKKLLDEEYSKDRDLRDLVDELSNIIYNMNGNVI